MNEGLLYIKGLINKVIIPIGAILAFFSSVWGILKGFPVEGILIAIIVIETVIFWGYHRRIIRKKDNEIASLQEQIEQYENPKQKLSPDVYGTYEIVDAKNPQGIEYKGTLKIDEWSKWLSCEWENREWAKGPKEINGIGLCVGKTLAFIYKYTKEGVDHTGVMHYMIKKDHLSGKCVEFGKPPRTGYEESKKK